MKILTMIEEGKISAVEGAELLKALTQPAEPAETSDRPAGKQPRRFRLVITDQHGENKVNVNLPMALVKVGLKMGARFAPNTDEEYDNQILASVKEAVQSGQSGKVAEISGSRGEKIEIFVD